MSRVRGGKTKPIVEEVKEPLQDEDNPYHWRHSYKFTGLQQRKSNRVTIDAIPSSFYGIAFDDLSTIVQMQVMDLVHTLIVEGSNDFQIMQELDMPPETLLWVKKRLYADAATAELDRTNLDRYIDFAQYVKCRTRDLMTMVQTAPNDSDKYLKAKIEAINKSVDMRMKLLEIGIEMNVIDKNEDANTSGRLPTTKMTNDELREYIGREKKEMANLFKELRDMGVELIEEDGEDEVAPEEAVSSFYEEESP